jgi:hypothetical protein
MGPSSLERTSKHVPDAMEMISVILASTMRTDEWEVELPIDIPAQGLIAKILTLSEFALPERDEQGRLIPYRLLWQEGNRHLKESETLREAKVQAGQTIVLTREARAGVTSPER